MRRKAGSWRWTSSTPKSCMTRITAIAGAREKGNKAMEDVRIPAAADGRPRPSAPKHWGFTHMYGVAFCKTIFEAPTSAKPRWGVSKVVLQNPHHTCVCEQCNSILKAQHYKRSKDAFYPVSLVTRSTYK